MKIRLVIYGNIQMILLVNMKPHIVLGINL
nr:MAG TPA: hypothetical protein [Caudoviricetes sp.]